MSNNIIEDEQNNELFKQFDDIIASLNMVKGQINFLQNNLKQLEKDVKKQMKGLKKEAEKNKNKGNRAPSGFVKPTRISDELAKFLEKPAGTEMARTDVTKQLNLYIRSNSLQDKENGRKINPDSKLQALLKLKKGDELTYFNLQKFMKHHFVKAEAAATA